MKKTILKIIAVLILAVFIFWFFILDMLVEQYIEKSGTKAVGAKVELSSVDVALFPAGIELFGLQVTNPDKPMKNSVEVSHIQAVIELMPLLKKNVIIDDLIFDKVQFNTERKQSGAVPGLKPVHRKGTGGESKWLEGICQQDTLNLFDMPDVEAILQKELKSLESVKLSKDVQKNIARTREKFQKKIDNLIDDKKIEEYRTRINKAGKGSSGIAMLGSALELNDLYKEIQGELDNIQNVQKEFKTELNNCKRQLKSVSTTLSKDVNRLKNKYSPLKGGKIDFGKIIFVPALCSFLKRNQKLIALVEPYFDLPGEKASSSNEPAKSSNAGNDVYFMAKNIKINLLFGGGTLTGKASNITNMPAVAKLPALIDFFGGGFKGLDSFNFKSVLDLVDPSHPHHKADLDISGFVLENFIFSDKPDLSLSLLKSVTSLTGSARLDDNQLNCLADIKFRDVIMKAVSSKGSTLQKALVNSLSKVNKFNLLFDLKGTLSEYTMAVKSDLDKIFQSSAQNMLQAKMGKFEKELKAGITAKTAGSAGQNNKGLADLSLLGTKLTEKSVKSSSLLKGIN